MSLIYCSRYKILKVIPFLAITLVSGCFRPTVDMEVLLPAHYSEASKLQRIAVLDFEGKRRKQMTLEFESLLTGILINDKPYFTIIDRRRLEKAMKEIALGQGGAISSRTAAKAGRMIGAQGIYTGRTDFQVQKSRYKESRSKCINNKSKCKEQERRQYMVACSRLDISFTLTPRLVNVQSGRVAYSKSYSDEKTVHNCEDQGPPPSNDTLLRAAIDTVMKKIRLDIAPYYQTLEVVLKKLDSDYPATEIQKNQFAGALEFAKSGRMDRACKIWEQLEKNGVSGVSMLFNLAACREVSGNLKEAKNLIYQADSALIKPDRDVNEFIKRIEQHLKSKDKVEKQTKTRRTRKSRRIRSNALVKKSQILLNKLSYNAGVEDGIMGNKTRRAVNDFQLETGLSQTGKVTQKLLEWLQKEAEKF